MIVAIVSLIGLAASAFLGVRELRRRAAAEDGLGRSGMGWGILFCALQAALVVVDLLGLAPSDPLSAIFAAAILTACAYASFARDRIWTRLSAFVGEAPDGTPLPTEPERTFRPDCFACDKRDICANRTPEEKTGALAAIARAFRAAGTTLNRAIHRPTGTQVLLLFVAGVCTMLALELPSNHDLTWVYPLCFLLEWALITAVMAGFFFLFQRRGGAAGVVATICWGIGIAEYFVIEFKSMPITPADLSALSTAAAVAGNGYVFALTPFCLYSIGFLAIALLLCSFATKFRPAKPMRTRHLLIMNLIVAALCLGGVTAHVTLIDYYNTLKITVYTWRPLESYWRQGFLPTFISSAQTIKPPVPENYTVEGAEELLNETAAAYDESELATSDNRAAATEQFDEEKPTVIAVMNETFSDLSIYQNMHADYQGPQFFNSLADCLQRGTLYVSAYGGGTCNTEFEFLTGNSMANLGSGVYPYTIYDLQETENLAAQFKELGYATTAMHPNHGTNWNRENVYEGFGFDQFLTIEDFQSADTLRGMVTDAATYDKILELLENNDDPQFIFDVTMQNHSGYDTGLLPADKQKTYTIDGEVDAEVDEYLSLIEESDRALQEFIGKLRQLDRKVIVVFFGDHQPFFPDTYNDRWFTGEDSVTHAERLWQTSYIIWANYDVAGNLQGSQEADLSTNYLGATLMQLIGAPLTDYQKAQLSLQQALKAINTTGFEDAQGMWYLATADENSLVGSYAQEADRARKSLATIQYYKLFGDGKDVYTKKHQSAANETNPNLAPGTTKVK